MDVLINMLSDKNFKKHELCKITCQVEHYLFQKNKMDCMTWTLPFFYLNPKNNNNGTQNFEKQDMDFIIRNIYFRDRLLD